MKTKLLLALLALLGMSQVVAQEYEYVPFVREGVKWVYYYDFPFDNSYIASGKHYYTLEIKGDTILNNKCYKKVHLYQGGAINTENDTIPVFLREENKIVYGIIPDEKRYWECPIGIGTMVNLPDFISTIETGVEFVLYDFNDPETFYNNIPMSDFMPQPQYHYMYADTVLIGNHMSKRHVLSLEEGNGEYFGDEFIIEGIGYVGNSPGTPVNYFYALSTGMTQVIYKLSHVIENNEIIFRTKNYSDDSYVPFVREGVKWVYYYRYNDTFSPTYPDLFSGTVYLNLEIKGDTTINGKVYKKMHKYYGDAINIENDTVPIYLREENKIVYGIVPDGVVHRDCIIGYGPTFVDVDPYCIFGQVWAGEEFILYDFNETKEYYEDFFSYWGDSEYSSYVRCDSVSIGDRLAKRHVLRVNMHEGYIIECVGFDGQSTGYTLAYYYLQFMNDPYFYFSHLVEDGKIVYKGIHYDPNNMTGIDEVVVDQRGRCQDTNYYNMMGQPVGKELPTTPGIYIHQGKKICVGRMP